jgi:hypothetical protein
VCSSGDERRNGREVPLPLLFYRRRGLLVAVIARENFQFVSGSLCKIHIEKMGEISHALVDQKLAREAGYPWYEVEADTANDFMTYLASALGKLASVDSSPVTDQATYLDRFAKAGVAEDRVVQQLQALRVRVLEKVLPIPSHAIEPSKIRQFKNRHPQLLADFRRRVERELIEAANKSDDFLQQRQLELFFDEAAVRREEIQAAMHGAGWKTIQGSLSVLSAVPGAPQMFGLVAALWDALSGRSQQIPSQDFAYAAYVRAEL